MCKSRRGNLKFCRKSCTMNHSYLRGCISWATLLPLVGYILSEDPTYITTYKGARSLIRKVDRDDLLQAMLRSYLNV